MEKEIIVIPNPNQIVSLSQIQHSLCSLINEKSNGLFFAIPAYPFCVKFDEPISIDDKITSLLSQEICFDKKNCFILIKAIINQKETNGKIELCTFSQAEENIPDFFKDIFENTKITDSLKKISPAKMAVIETDEKPNGKTWKIKSEKWFKT